MENNFRLRLGVLQAVVSTIEVDILDVVPHLAKLIAIEIYFSLVEVARLVVFITLRGSRKYLTFGGMSRVE